MFKKRCIMKNSDGRIWKQFKCKLCQRDFFSENYFFMHLQSHASDKKYLCEICGKRFSTFNFFKTHLNKHTKKKLQINQFENLELDLDFSIEEHSEDLSIDELKKFSCKLCKKKFFKESYLIFHLRFHIKEKCLLCHLCGKRYSYHHYFKMHLYTHTRTKAAFPNFWQTTIHVKQELSQPFDQIESLNPVEPWQGAAIASTYDRTDNRKAISISSEYSVLSNHDDMALLPEHNSEFSCIPEQGPSVSDIYEQASSSHSSIVDIGTHSLAQIPNVSHCTVQKSSQSFTPEQTSTEECILGLEAPDFGQPSHSHLSVVIDTSGEKKYFCVVCKKTFIFPCNLNQHLRIHWHKKLLSCRTCQKEFREHESLNDHVCVDTKPFICDFCHEAFPHQRNLSQHMRVHSTMKSYVCGVCGNLYKLKTRLNIHIKRAHKRKQYFYCSSCEKQFLHFGALETHVCTPVEKLPYVCDVCNVSFHDKATLFQHACPYAVKDLCFCNICRKMNPQRYPSSDQVLYACNSCEETFSQKLELREHLRKHAESELLTCEKCKAKFSYKCDYKSHIRLCDPRYMLCCVICNEKFTSKTFFKEHVDSHSQKSDLRENPTNEAESKILLSCEKCGKTFTSKGWYNSHIRSCDSKKLLCCAICNKKFTGKILYKKHVNSHSENEFYIKIFECHICDKIFSRKHHLIRHLNEHSE